MVYICTKFHEHILNGIRVMGRTRKVNGWTVFDGRIKIAKFSSHVHYIDVFNYMSLCNIQKMTFLIRQKLKIEKLWFFFLSNSHCDAPLEAQRNELLSAPSGTESVRVVCN